MKRLIYAVAVVLMGVAATGCSTHALPRYAVSTGNVAELRKIKSTPVAIGSFITAGSDVADSIFCRAVGPIKTPDGETYADYIKKALVSELTMVEMYDAKSAVVLSGELTTFSFDSHRGVWDMALRLKSSNGKQLSVSEKYDYGFNWFALVACAQTAQAGMSAVQNLIHKAVSDPGFSSLLPQPRAGSAVNPIQ